MRCCAIVSVKGKKKKKEENKGGGKGGEKKNHKKRKKKNTHQTQKNSLYYYVFITKHVFHQHKRQHTLRGSLNQNSLPNTKKKTKEEEYVLLVKHAACNDNVRGGEHGTTP